MDIQTKPQNILEIFATAQSHLKWPKLIYMLDRDNKIVFYPMKQPTKMNGALWVTNGKKKYDGGKIYGIVTNSPSFQPNAFNCTIDLCKIIIEVCKDPVTHAKIKGLEFSNCCFCGLELTNKNSLIAGYGPICAEKWGLPWDGLADDKELGDL